MEAIKESAEQAVGAKPAFESRPCSFRLGTEVAGLDLQRSADMYAPAPKPKTRRSNGTPTSGR